MPPGDWLRDRVQHAIVVASDVPVSRGEGIVHQALGMTMEFVGCSALPALELLDAQSTATGQSLFAVAVDVIERRYRPVTIDR
jgi:hypothetical protein